MQLEGAAMRISRPAILTLVLLFCAHELSAGFLPKRRAVRRPFKHDGAAILQRGPSYAPASVGSTEGVQNLIQQSKPGINDIALQVAGLGGGNCDTSALSQLRSIEAQLLNILAQLQAAQIALSGCGLDAGCVVYWGNRAITLGNQATVIGAQAQALLPAAQAAAACQAQGGGSGGGQASPPGLTYENLARRFSVPLKGGAGSSGSLGGFSSPVLDQLAEDVENGRIPDYDGRQKAQSKALGAYQKALQASVGLGRKVEAGKAFANKPARDFSDPTAAAQQEYLRINYEVLGPKYKALAEGRSEKADAYAKEVLASAPSVPLPSEEAAVIKVPEVADFQAIGAGILQDPHVQEMAEQVKGDLGEAFEGMLEKMGVKKELISILKIDAAVAESRHLIPDLHAAVREMGSASLSTQSNDNLQQKLGAYFEHVKTVTKDEAKAWFGGGDD
jgi:hypothetical protein